MKGSETEPVWTTCRWLQYGLGIQPGVPESVTATRCHDMVCEYLDKHPEVADKYRADQRGVVKYFDVLALAEAEAAA